ncbi:hypothetical protein Taro_020878 [Colocasia esculenta]|uniref:Uncharacterized protein n=1 Tax=Colocasia esculenta TaxID=4460 RepID=A0A843UPT5_COLES|nr:hypothetical protein [Colocasia esculenta]
MRGECPELKKKLKKDKFTFKKAKAMMATWSDEDEDKNTQGRSGDEEIQCLMARSEDSKEIKFFKNNLPKNKFLKSNILKTKTNQVLQQSEMSGSSLSCASPSSWLPRASVSSLVGIPSRPESAKVQGHLRSVEANIGTTVFRSLSFLRAYTSPGYGVLSLNSSSPVVIEFFNNMEMAASKDLYTTVREYYTLITQQCYDTTKDHVKLNANSFPPLNRLIHHIFTTLVAPKDGSRELITEIHKSFFFFFLNTEQINLPQLMVDLIKQCFTNPKRSMPYAYPITSLLSFIGIPISDAECITLKSRSAFDLTATHRMGYKLIDGRVIMTLKGKEQDIDKESAEDAEAVEDADDGEDSQPKPMDAQGGNEDALEEQAPPAQEPSLRDFIAGQIAQIQQSITTGFDHLSARFDQLQEHVNTRMDALADSHIQIQHRLTWISTEFHEGFKSLLLGKEVFLFSWKRRLVVQAFPLLRREDQLAPGGDQLRKEKKTSTAWVLYVLKGDPKSLPGD